VKRLKLDNPSEEITVDWYQSAMDVFRKDDWLGTPKSSMELHLLNRTREIEAQNVERLEPLLDDLTVFGCVKDLNLERMRGLDRNREYITRRAKIDRNYEQQDNWEMSSYLANVYGAIPDQHVNLEFFSVDAEVKNLNYNLSIVKEIQEKMEEDDNFSVTGVELSGYSVSNSPKGSYRMFDESMMFDLYFLYGGDKELTEEYNEVSDKWNDFHEYSGVPGSVKVGQRKPMGYLFDSEELSSDGAIIDDWLYDELDSNIDQS